MNLPFAINAPSPSARHHQGRDRGWTLVEAMLGMGVGMLALAAVASTTIFCLRSFAGIYNYSDLDASSRQVLDTISREIREATSVVTNEPTATGSFIQLVNANAAPPVTNTFTWDSGQQTLSWDKTGYVTNMMLLTNCASWTCTLLEGYPSNNYSFPDVAPTAAACKIVDVRWSCYRTIMRLKMNSETEQGAQIVLRN